MQPTRYRYLAGRCRTARSPGYHRISEEPSAAPTIRPTFANFIGEHRWHQQPVQPCPVTNQRLSMTQMFEQPGPTVRFLQLDVFTARAGGGNPLGVVIGAGHWSGEQMQRFARWTRLVETTFLLAPDATDANYRVRIFTPQREIAFAGHPSIGSAHAALHAGLIAPAPRTLVQQCEAGLIQLQVDGDGSARRLFVQTPEATRMVASDANLTALERLLGGLSTGPMPPALISGGRRWWLAEIRDEASLRAYKADYRAIAQLALDSDSLGLCLFARSSDPQFDLVVRAFPCGVGIDEDPASGAANGLIASHLRQSLPADPLTSGYRVSQGREIGHDALIEVRYDSDGCSWIGGQTQTVIDGWLSFDCALDEGSDS